MIINGYAGLTEQGRRYTRDPYRGLSTEILYEGPKEAVLAAYSSIPTTQYVECDTMKPGPFGTLLLRSPDYGNGSTPTASDVQTSYDLLPNVAQRSVYESPRFSESTITDVKARVKIGSAGTLTGDNLTLFNYVMAGHDTFFTSEIIFRITDVIALGYEHNVVYSNTNRIYTSAQLVVETDPSPFYVAGIEAAEATVLADIYGGTIPSGLVLGWLKQFPGTVNIANNKVAVTIEYWLGAWPTLFYYQR